jgi:prepilin-type N-terminal cleavage/methylation domain-containing protein
VRTRCEVRNLVRRSATFCRFRGSRRSAARDIARLRATIAQSCPTLHVLDAGNRLATYRGKAMRNTQDGFTLVELLIVVAIIGILAGLTAHHVLAAKAAANEASAVGTLRAVNSGQATYASTCAQGSYAPTITQLATGKFASPDIAFNPKSGYLIALTTDLGVDGPTDCNGDSSKTAYYLSATPVSNLTGIRAFATNPAGTIWQNMVSTAPTEPFVAGGTISTLQSGH